MDDSTIRDIASEAARKAQPPREIAATMDDLQSAAMYGIAKALRRHADKPRGYYVVAANNGIRDYIRRELAAVFVRHSDGSMTRRARVIVNHDAAMAIADGASDGEPDPPRGLIQAEQVAQVQRVLEQWASSANGGVSGGGDISPLPLYASIITLRHVSGDTQCKVAGRLGLSQPRVSELERAALALLRERLAASE